MYVEVWLLHGMDSCLRAGSLASSRRVCVGTSRHEGVVCGAAYGRAAACRNVPWHLIASKRGGNAACWWGGRWQRALKSFVLPRRHQGLHAGG